MSEHAIRVLSIRQPYADQILSGEKWCENRTWTTKYRGPLFIHASRWEPSEPRESPGSGVTGAILGCVDLIDVLEVERMSDRQLIDYARRHGLPSAQENLQHACGPVGLIVANPRFLEAPYPIGGKLNIWRTTIPGSVYNSLGVTAPTPAPSPANEPGPSARSRSTPVKPVPRMAESPPPLRVGTRVLYRQRPYVIGAIDEELVGLCDRRGGPIVAWEVSSEVEITG